MICAPARCTTTFSRARSMTRAEDLRHGKAAGTVGAFGSARAVRGRSEPVRLPVSTRGSFARTRTGAALAGIGRAAALFEPGHHALFGGEHRTDRQCYCTSWIRGVCCVGGTNARCSVRRSRRAACREWCHVHAGPHRRCAAHLPGTCLDSPVSPHRAPPAPRSRAVQSGCGMLRSHHRRTPHGRPRAS